MARFTGATLSVLGGLAGALFVAGAVATGCGGDDTTGTNNNSTSTSSKTSTSTATSSTGTSSATSSTSGSTGSDAGDAGDGSAPSDAGDAGTDGDATVTPPCNSVALLGDAGTLLFSFDDGGISATIGTQSANWSSSIIGNPLDASFAVVGGGNATVGEWCPGSFEMVVPFTTLGQGAKGSIAYPGTGAPYNAKALHFSLRLAFPDNTDASTVYLQDLLQVDGSDFSYLQVFAQWSPAAPDGGAPDGSYQAQNYSNVSPNGYLAFPADGGWTQQTVPITVKDPGDAAVSNATAPVAIYLNQIGLQVFDPQAPGGDAAGLAPLPMPLNVQFFVDDVWVE
jgi:hypothetical protein